MADLARAVKLKKLLDTVLNGKTVISTVTQSKQFIDAICAQADHAECIDRIIAADDRGLEAIRTSLRTDLSPNFFNSYAKLLLEYLQHPAIRAISGGQYLEKILQAIVDPPIFLNPFVEAFKNGSLSDSVQKCFSWLLLQLLTLSSTDNPSPYLKISLDVEPVMARSHLLDVRNFAAGIRNVHAILATPPTNAVSQEDHPPGGRHDNDFADFRHIAILPTSDEIACTTPPFLRVSAALDDPENEVYREGIYLDHFFRLTREEMINEMREELPIVLGVQPQKKRRAPVVVKGLRLVGVDVGDENRRSRWGLVFESLQDWAQLASLSYSERLQFFKDNTKILKHGSLCVFVVEGRPVAFPTIRRNEDLLARQPPRIVLELDGQSAVIELLLRTKVTTDVQLVPISTALFAFEPILNALKRMKTLPLTKEILFWNPDQVLEGPTHPSSLSRLIAIISRNPKTDVGQMLDLGKQIILDPAQAKSLLSGLKQNLSIIQGPPGTGKSFIGALLAKFLYTHTDSKILVVCYTNHALDQFLNDLLSVNIPEVDMVRLGGGKTSERTRSMLLRNQPCTHRFSNGDNSIITQLKSDGEQRGQSLQSAFGSFINSSVGNADLLVHLEFEEPDFFEAFTVPISEDGMAIVGKKGRAVNEFYLIDRWRNGQDPGVFTNTQSLQNSKRIWSLADADRRSLVHKWVQEILVEKSKALYEQASRYDRTQDELQRKFRERDLATLKSKRIIGCTTTAAAKYTTDLVEAGINVLLVEEAGEILESHIITALGPSIKQVILIGDHKQLRPKVNNYNLTIEKGDGYDLNRSLFERLVLKGYPHETLVAQHRMRPEISALIRHLVYPDLLDAQKTLNRPNILGLQDNVIFIDHSKPEGDEKSLADRRDLGSKTSKQNAFEARMVLRIIKYLAQQGYRTEDLVVLTPYLGQLYKLQHELQSETDPVLSDLDNFELIQAGLHPHSHRKGNKKLRLATIDNYQGEESDIVVVSLTRSNNNHDIGFMFAPERLNVLLSRARNGLILIGNSDTFTHARKGHELWSKLLAYLREHKHVYDGLPVVCQQHVDRKCTVVDEAQFDDACPDGGCSEPCGVLLSCGIHQCPSKCHRISDHSNVRCLVSIDSRCPKGHIQSHRCSEPPLSICKKCDKLNKQAQAQQEKERLSRLKRQQEEDDHLRKLKELEQKLQEQQELVRDAQLKQQRANELQQKSADVEEAAARALSIVQQVGDETKTRVLSIMQQIGQKVMPNVKPASEQPELVQNAQSKQQPSAKTVPTSSAATRNTISTSAFANMNGNGTPSESELRWQHKQSVEGASNQAVEAIMNMAGLEEVKSQILNILDNIEVKQRQGVRYDDERYNVAFLGNPGTGKTTVARHYAKYLSSVGAISGNAFEETTGSKLASDGVKDTSALLDRVKNAGGGVIFIDEAYQLVSGVYGGKEVLDFLLAEMENNIGKLVFILAGYNKQMEKFFEHNPGIPSRVPHTFHFLDYTDDQLRMMLERKLHSKFDGRLKIEDGIHGLYGRIAVRRLGRGRGREGFGNARALENLMSTILKRQASRLAKERASGKRPDDLELVQVDLIGEDPSVAIKNCDSWRKLHDLTGLDSVKRSIDDLYDMILRNYSRELKEEEPLQVTLNKCFIGSPGTGKTTVAKLYGQILVDLGLLSNGEVVMKNPSDFIGNVLGASESQTKAILASTVGKVLIIDEAYMLHTGKTNQSSDLFKTAVIDTIVAEVQSTLGEDRCVILCGYEKEMRDMFQAVNPGLSRRFAIEDAFKFEDFSSNQLLDILNLKLKQQALSATEDAKKVAQEVLERAKMRPNFGNGGDVENLISKAKSNYVNRTRGSSVPQDTSIVFEPADFDPHFNRVEDSDKIDELFKDVVGCGDIVEKMRHLQKVAQTGKTRGENVSDLVPTTWVFKGPPGTGKTTTARKMGEIYHNLGLLASPEVHECSASDLIAQYVGQTGPRVQDMFKKAAGKVLFIDEAYRLGQGHFAQEAVDEIVTLLTDERYRGKIVVIIAGYREDINELLSSNRGLSSRFTDEVLFSDLQPTECITILMHDLAAKKVIVAGIADVTKEIHRNILDLFEEFISLNDWGNARDVKTLAKKMVERAFVHNNTIGDSVILSAEEALYVAREMLTDRRSRENTSPSSSRRRVSHAPVQLPPVVPPQAPPPPSVGTSTTSAPTTQFDESQQPKKETSKSDSRTRAKRTRRKVQFAKNQGDQASSGSSNSRAGEQKGSTNHERDPGVSDQVWDELQKAKQKQQAEEAREQRELEAAIKAAQEAAKKASAERKLAQALAEAAKKEQDRLKKEELERKLKEQKKREQEAILRRKEQEAKLRAEREARERAKKKEEEAQRKLQHMGVCVAGFAWIHQGNGYRCAGGSHFVSNHQLDL
ncbi:P-loop containing nucleoside triphosphate hydrolase protein [Lentinula raphanica]|uniref:P-loop containing nucleoside triphosphate hydrolase protein n=1 Tax=Lentinula raphanica TaxID=153919 RepID=A0AA38P0V1_9AGAR|nr:P-loop containing nucleoside triphosphate hydrolase protein [Lentinula raphanica]